ncbi:MAG TPA: TonB-dependent receptor, partial [Gammaproteobacteria bacterium]|nr:TonB-dependent receptor [Gammaproteobacteria bacterium]
MSTQNLVSKAVRLALVCGAASALGSQAALADDTTSTTTTATTSNTSTAQLGKIEVTGTRIKRTDVETAQPVNIVTAQQIKATGLATVGQIVQKLTSSGAALNTLDNFGGNFTFTGGGQSNVDLRNLGAQRVLVLVNGKRWATALDGTVDLNTIPVAVIDHIEVLQDGASAIYGSDAIAGVVNIITVKDYNGNSADAYMGMYNGDGHWDGKTTTYDFTTGSSNDKSGIIFSASYSNQDPIPSAHRNISKEPVIGQGPASGSSAIPNGRFVFIAPGTTTGSDPNNSVNPATGLTAAQCPTTNFGSAASPNYQPLCDLTLIPGTAGNKPGDFRPFVSGGANSDRFNYAPFNYVLTPEERYSGYLQGYSDLADNITFKYDMMYSHRDSFQQAAPEPLFFASSSIALNIPANQKYNPFGFDLNASGSSPNLLLLGRRMVENGVRLYHEKEDMYRFSGGFNGYFNMLGGEWDWDAGYAFSKDDELDTNAGHFDVSHLRLALGDPNICAAVAGCVPLNLFDGAAGITKPMLNYVAYTAQNQFENNQRVYNADITNSNIGTLPGGPIGLAIGVEDLEHDGFFLPDSVAQNGYDSFNPGRPVEPTSGRTSEKSLYAETDLPILGDMPGIKLLDLDLAGRYTKYNTFGTNHTYRWGLKYQPNSEWLVRASWSQGFRAPSINDLYSGNTNLSANINDPCDAPAKSPVCALQGVPSNYTQPNAQINTLEGGNPNLKPETSVSRTIGFVYSPDWLAGFNLSADYYHIDIEGTIEPISGQVLMDECYTANVADSNPAACAKIKRTVFGTVQTLADQVTNTGTTTTSGIDVAASYTFPSTSVGDFKLTLDETHIKSYIVDGTELAGTERGGTVFPFGIPKNKAQLALNWAAGSWTAEYDLRFIGAVYEPCTTTAPAPIGTGTCSNPGPINPAGTQYKYAVNHDGATVYHDVQASYTVDSLGTTFSLGIRNLFAKEPPISSVQELNSFDPTLYDV